MADPAHIAHLLRRTEYIARPARVTALSAGTLEAAVDDILDISPTPVPLPWQIASDVPNNRWNQYVFATQWWMDRMVDSPKPMQEKMTFFWHGHFVSARSKVDVTWMLAMQNKLYRDQGLGNFVSLTQAMALEPAMLVYLDNADNTKQSPNQNFARELMELFTLGVGNYTEEDVESSARAWTGHGIEWNDQSPNFGKYVFRSGQHDNGNKRFFNVVSNYDGPDIIDAILNGPKKLIAAKFIVNKLWEYFAHQGTPPAVLNELGASFAADWEIKPLIRALLLRAEFYTPTAMQGMVRTPTDWVVAIMHATGKRAGELNPQWYMDGMGQQPLDPPNVSGWRPNGYWINTSAFGARASFARGVTWRLRQNDGYADLADMSVTDAINTVADLFGLTPLSTPTRTAMTSYLNAQRIAEPWHGWWEPTNLLTMAMLAPEMHVA